MTPTTADTFRSTFGDLRVALHAPPALRRWSDVKAYLKRLHTLSPERVEAEVLPYVEGIVRRGWRDHQRMLWTDDAIWRYIAADPRSRYSRIFSHVRVRPGAQHRLELDRVLDGPLLTHVDHVTIVGHEHAAALLHRLLGSRHLEALRSLEITRSDLRGLTYTRPTRRTQIERLVFKHAGLSPDEVRKLCAIVENHGVTQLELLCSEPLDLRSQHALLDLSLEHLTLCNAGLAESGALHRDGCKRSFGCSSLDVREHGRRLHMPAARFRDTSRIR